MTSSSCARPVVPKRVNAIAGAAAARYGARAAVARRPLGGRDAVALTRSSSTSAAGG